MTELKKLAITIFEKIKKSNAIQEGCTGAVVALRIQKNSKSISITDDYVLGKYVNDNYKQYDCVNLTQLSYPELKSINREIFNG